MANATGAKKAKTATDANGSVAKKKRVTLKDIDLNDLVEVRSCVYGALEYISRKTGYKVRWSDFGQSEYLTVDELLAMRNGQRAFFENQWVVIVGDNAEDVINFLQLEKYYSQISDIGDVDKILKLPAAKIHKALDKLTAPAKENIARRAYDLIDRGELTDISVIRAVEKSLGYELTD